MELLQLLTLHDYRPVICLTPKQAGTQIDLAVTFTPEAGPWHFRVPFEARRPYFVVSERLDQTLIVLRDESAYVGTTASEVVNALKAIPSIRQFVDQSKGDRIR